MAMKWVFGLVLGVVVLGLVGCACATREVRAENGGGVAAVPVEAESGVGLVSVETGEGESALAEVGTVPIGGACGAGVGVCDAAGYCAHPEGNACGDGGVAGVCEARPTACKRDCPGVCGCDGQRFCNSCVARARGFSVRHAGSCRDASE